MAGFHTGKERRNLTLGLLVLATGFILTLTVLLFFSHFLKPAKPVFGVTFSQKQAEFLGLDIKEVYGAVLNDLQVKHVRLPFYWDTIETAPGVYDWTYPDYFLNQALESGALVTPVIGFRVPRWSECHIPSWAKDLTEDEFQAALFRYLESAVLRYKDSSAVVAWQVENESLFAFGECPEPKPELLFAEVAVVRSLDNARPIQLTMSGEQEVWLALAKPADILGVSLYRVVHDERAGTLVYPHTPSWYLFGRLLVSPWVHKVIISELQAEPWLVDGVYPKDGAASLALFTKEDFLANLKFSQATGFSEVYLWGVEWWYYVKQKGESDLWRTAQEIFVSE